MTPAQEELFDLAILRVLDRNRSRFGLISAAIGHLMVEFGFPSPDPDLLLDRLDYLTRKSLIQEVAKLVGNANRAWRITEDGLQYVDGR